MAADVTDEHVAVVDGDRVPYTLRESSRAERARIDVDPGGVEVVVPAPSTNRVDPDALLRANAEWLAAKRAEMAAVRERAPDRRFEPGATWPVLGRDRTLVVERRRSSTVDGDRIRIARSHVDRTSLRRALEYCFRETAREQFEARVDALAPRMGVADDVAGIEVRNQQTRWGSCSTTGTLSLNWRLIMAPPGVLGYVVVHELAHLREHNHSNAFWGIVERFDPAWERHRQWLRENRAELIFTEADL